MQNSQKRNSSYTYNSKTNKRLRRGGMIESNGSSIVPVCFNDDNDEGKIYKEISLLLDKYLNIIFNQEINLVEKFSKQDEKKKFQDMLFPDNVNYFKDMILQHLFIKPLDDKNKDEKKKKRTN